MNEELKTELNIIKAQNVINKHLEFELIDYSKDGIYTIKVTSVDDKLKPHIRLTKEEFEILFNAK